MFVDSKKKPNTIEVLGFEMLDQSAYMMEWLRKGKDYRRFVALDLEHELYAQDQGAQLLSLQLKSQPIFETKVRKDKSGMRAIVTSFSVSLPVSLRVKASNGVVWVLSVNHNYQMENMDFPEKLELRLNFTVTGSQVEV